MPVRRSSNITSPKMGRRQLKEYVSDEKSPYTETKVHGEREILYKDKLYIPKDLQYHVINRYYWFLCYPGSTRLAKTIQHTYNWPKLVTHAEHKVKK